MVSGWAGGIGLCGGACGALGAAIWLLSLSLVREQGGRIGYQDPRIQRVIDRFMNHTNYTFECSAIVGRTFTDTQDHAEYLQAGGCSELLRLLAADSPPPKEA